MTRCRKTLSLRSGVLAIAAFAVASPSVRAGSEIFVGSRVAGGNQVSIDRIDHSDWDALLRKYVDGDGMVRYAALKNATSDVQSLDRYLRTLSSANPRLRASRNAKLAFWINAYNAVTVRGILREYPTSSIRNHTAKLWGYNIWNDLQLYVGGRPYSLDQMEHEILRKMSEPRIHFAIVCASVGCPRLLNAAYVSEQVQKQLETNARDFFSRSRNFRYDERAGRVYLSSILKWFGEDFGANQAAQLRAIAQWLPTERSRRVAQKAAVKVSFLDYDWNLNETK